MKVKKEHFSLYLEPDMIEWLKKEADKDGEIKTACQQVCASDAIVFGNILDKNSKVAKTRETKRAYAVLQELNTKPRTLYLARIKNPHPSIQKKFNYI